TTRSPSPRSPPRSTCRSAWCACCSVTCSTSSTSGSADPCRPPCSPTNTSSVRSSIDSAPSDADTPVLALRIRVASGYVRGKTTLVGAVSEIRPLRTEEQLTAAGRGVDDTGGVEQKTTTTVAMDFGRITIREGLSVYLFGTPGQDRFWFLWDELAQ